MFVTWTHYDNNPEKHGFVLYRNGVKIAEHVPEDDKWGPFSRSSQFDRDHNTNLFRKNEKKLIYVDSGLPQYQEIKYEVEKIRYSGQGKIVASVMSKPFYVRTE